MRRIMMTDNQRQFQRLYAKDVLIQGGEMSKELLELFETVLKEFDDKPEKMSLFIENISPEDYQN